MNYVYRVQTDHEAFAWKDGPGDIIDVWWDIGDAGLGLVDSRAAHPDREFWIERRPAVEWERV